MRTHYKRGAGHVLVSSALLLHIKLDAYRLLMDTVCRVSGMQL